MVRSAGQQAVVARAQRLAAGRARPFVRRRIAALAHVMHAAGVQAVIPGAQALAAGFAQSMRRCVAGALARVVRPARQQAVVAGAQRLAARRARLMRAAYALARVVCPAGQQAVIPGAQALAAGRAQPVQRSVAALTRIVRPTGQQAVVAGGCARIVLAAGQRVPVDRIVRVVGLTYVLAAGQQRGLMPRLAALRAVRHGRRPVVCDRHGVGLGAHLHGARPVDQRQHRAGLLARQLRRPQVQRLLRQDLFRLDRAALGRIAQHHQLDVVRPVQAVQLAADLEHQRRGDGHRAHARVVIQVQAHVGHLRNEHDVLKAPLQQHVARVGHAHEYALRLPRLRVFALIGHQQRLIVLRQREERQRLGRLFQWIRIVDHHVLRHPQLALFADDAEVLIFDYLRLHGRLCRGVGRLRMRGDGRRQQRQRQQQRHRAVDCVLHVVSSSFRLCASLSLSVEMIP